MDETQAKICVAAALVVLAQAAWAGPSEQTAAALFGVFAYAAIASLREGL